MNRRALLALIAGGLVLSISVGVRQCFGLFIGPMSVDLALSTSVFGFAVAMQQLMWGATQPLVGMLADRFGTRPVLCLGAAGYAGGLVVLASGGGATSLYLGSGVLIGLALSGTAFSVVFGAIARVVPPEKRSLASGIAGAGGSFGQFLFAPVGQSAISSFGWPTTFLIFAAVAACMAPLAWLLAPKSADAQSSTTAVAEGTIGAAFAQAFGQSSYWLLNAGFFVCGFHVAFVSTYLPGIASLCGLPATIGAQALAIIGLGNMFGSYAAGALGGHFPMRYLLAAIYFIRCAAILVFLATPKTETVFLVFSAVLGVTWLGTVPLTSGIVATMFSPRYLASLFGFVFFTHQVGAFFGAWLGGQFFDRTGSYDGVWHIALALAFVAGLLHLPIRERAVVAAQAR